MNKIKGFTLIELLVAMALIGILSAISYPSYLEFIKSTYRATAENEMVNIAYRMEKIKIKSFSYKAAIDDKGKLKAMIHEGYFPLQGEARYLFSATAEDNTYQIIATPTNRQGATYGKLKLSFNGNQYERKWDINNNNQYDESW